MVSLVFIILLALLGVPLFAVIVTGAMIGFNDSEIDLSVIAVEIYRIAEMPALITLPLFTFAGYLLGESQAPTRLLNLTNALLGWVPGGMAFVALAACAFFTAFTGATGITIVALGALLYPALKQAGYPDNFNLGLITTSGSLGLLFAPSLPLILYGVIAQQMNLPQPLTIDQMFLAGILPGLLMIIMLTGWSLWVNRGTRVPLSAFSFQKLTSAIKAAAWELPIPVIILGGIYGGVFAISEAAAVTALYVLIVEVFVLKDISLKNLPGIVRESMILVGAILIILGVSLASTNYMIDSDVPTLVFDAVKEFITSKLTFLLVLNVFLLILGAFLDIFSALVIMVPLLIPLALAYGVDPVHLGIIFLANMQIGYITPPVGMNLFIASYRFDKPVLQLYVATLPFFFLLLAAVLIITYVPALSLVLIQ
ncbi:MAG: TRAP transporter large permease [Acidiferrobacterales bacterium]